MSRAIYVVRSELGHVKVGISSNPRERFNRLRGASDPHAAAAGQRLRDDPAAGAGGGRVGQHPAVQGGVVDLEAALEERLLDVTVTRAGITQSPCDGLQGQRCLHRAGL